MRGMHVIEAHAIDPHGVVAVDARNVPTVCTVKISTFSSLIRDALLVESTFLFYIFRRGIDFDIDMIATDGFPRGATVLRMTQLSCVGLNASGGNNKCCLQVWTGQ